MNTGLEIDSESVSSGEKSAAKPTGNTSGFSPAKSRAQIPTTAKTSAISPSKAPEKPTSNISATTVNDKTSNASISSLAGKAIQRSKTPPITPPANTGKIETKTPVNQTSSFDDSQCSVDDRTDTMYKSLYSTLDSSNTPNSPTSASTPNKTSGPSTPRSASKTPSTSHFVPGSLNIPPYKAKYDPCTKATVPPVPCYEQPFGNIHNLEMDPKTFAQFEEEDFNPIPPDQHLRSLPSFNPRLYDFILDDYKHVKHVLKTNTRTDNIEVSCPPFETLFDHVIAVIWFFYSDVNNWYRFSVPQLEWASKFLQGIVSNRRDTFEDVEQMRKHLDELIYLNYSETDEKKLYIPKPPEKKDDDSKDLDLPLSLVTLFGRAPNFVNCLSLYPLDLCCKEYEKTATSNSKPDQAETIKKMKLQLERLNAYEKKYINSRKKDVELTEIINGIKNHGDELVKLRLEKENGCKK